jgi:uncharacterized protein YggU (UPF0235/DUF167 family)
MKIKVKVHPGSSREEIVCDGWECEVWLREKAVGGKANLALVKILAKEFSLKKRDVEIKTLRGRKKIVEIII